ncbi:MAG: zinc ribbon domain-containing protein [Dehalococcoidia bacterium]|nr:zinc ribbon domain-containing protein [Dehalococcoidia bacterium]
MPVYEYRCSKGHNYERTEGFDAPSRQRCLTCSAPARRRISLPAVIFKGSGFYSTDNRKGGSSGNGSAPSDSAAAKDGPSHADAPQPPAETKVEAAKAE